MEPNSVVLVVLLFAMAAGVLVIASMLRWVWLRAAAGALALTLSASAGVAVVNDYYGYYTTWSALATDLSGSYAGFSTATRARPLVTAGGGRLESVRFAGRSSGISRGGFVYLPPQYFWPRYARTAFPVVELLHGTPGTPAAWLVQFRILDTIDRLLALHLIGPLIVVMPTISVGRHFQECVDAPRALDGTYLTADVRRDVIARFRASRQPAEWGIAGYSSGGYCAADLALRHRSSFGAAGIMDGYFRPTDGPAAAALHRNRAAEAANDPLRLAAALSRDTRPLPSFWVAAGTGNRGDVAAATAFTAALHGVEQVTLYREPGAGHNFYAWRPAVPRLLSWMWTQLAPPSLRVDFPITGPVRQSIIPAPGARPARARKRRHPIGVADRPSHRRGTPPHQARRPG